MSYLDSRIIILNSAHGISMNGTYKSNLLFTFNGLLSNEDNIERVEMSVVNCQIPVSFYTVNYTNNMFKIKLGDNAVQNYYIQVGNYNANSLILALNTLINDSNFVIKIITITVKLSFTYNVGFYIY